MNDKKVSTNRQKKEVLIAEYVEKIDKAKGMVFANYQGLTHHQLENLKRALKKVDADFIATKNSLIKLALKEKSKALGTLDTPDTFDTFFKKPTATLFIYNDIIEPLKQLAKTIKEFTLPIIKFGVLSREAGSRSAGEGFELLTSDQIMKLSSLAPLPVLRAQLLGQMKAPISGLHRALQWNLQKLVLTLNAVKDKKQSA